MTDFASTGPAGASRVARAAARQLAPGYGSTLAGDVEAILRRDVADRYVDPVAVASLVVAAAQLTWTVVLDLRRRRAKIDTPEVTDAVRAALPEDGSSAGTRDRVIDVVVEEALRPARGPSTPADVATPADHSPDPDPEP